MMHKRIHDLALQAGGSHYPDVGGKTLEKFAELIVAECANQVDWILAEGGKTQGDLIKEHFGVEEHKGWVCPKCGVDRTRNVCPKGHTAALIGDCPMIATAQTGVEE